jgi:hypothetical protein
MHIFRLAVLPVAAMLASAGSAEAQTKYYSRQYLGVQATNPAAPVDTTPAAPVYDGKWTPQTSSGTAGACLRNTKTTTYQPTCIAKSGAVDASAASCDPAAKAAAVRTSSAACYSSCPVPVSKPNRIINTTYGDVIKTYPLTTGTLAQVAVLAKTDCENFGLGSLYKVRICQVAREASNYTVSMMIAVNPPVDSTPASNVYWSECTYASNDS